MAEDLTIKASTKEGKYAELFPQIQALISGETDTIANLANVCAALKYGMSFLGGVLSGRRKSIGVRSFSRSGCVYPH